MKKREEIVKNVSAYNYKFPDNVIIELLLDIRELLLKACATTGVQARAIETIAKQEIDPKLLKKL